MTIHDLIITNVGHSETFRCFRIIFFSKFRFVKNVIWMLILFLVASHSEQLGPRLVLVEKRIRDVFAVELFDLDLSVSQHEDLFAWDLYRLISKLRRASRCNHASVQDICGQTGYRPTGTAALAPAFVTLEDPLLSIVA